MSKIGFMKVVLVGEMDVGKSSLINKFCGKDGPASATVSGDF
jgi:ribosome biogenesis GTPase A